MQPHLPEAQHPGQGEPSSDCSQSSLPYKLSAGFSLQLVPTAQPSPGCCGPGAAGLWGRVHLTDRDFNTSLRASRKHVKSKKSSAVLFWEGRGNPWLAPGDILLSFTSLVLLAWYGKCLEMQEPNKPGLGLCPGKAHLDEGMSSYSNS